METHRFFDKWDALLENPTLPDKGRGDAMLRTFYYYISNKHSRVIRSMTKVAFQYFIDQCTKHFGTNGILRHPEVDNNDTSQDAMIGYILLNKELLTKSEFQELMRRLPRQISDEYKWTSPWWNWVKYHQGKSHGHWFLLSTIFFGMSYWSNWVLKYFKVTKGSSYLPYFNVHLAAWMIWSMDNRNPLRWLARTSLAIATPKTNALVRMLLRKDYNNTLAYPARGWKWQRLPWVKYTGIDNSEISPEEAGYTIDIDILKNI